MTLVAYYLTDLRKRNRPVAEELGVECLVRLVQGQSLSPTLDRPLVEKHEAEQKTQTRNRHAIMSPKRIPTSMQNTAQRSMTAQNSKVCHSTVKPSPEQHDTVHHMSLEEKYTYIYKK